MLNNLLSLKQIVLALVVIAHGRLLLPCFLELLLLIHNLVSLCLHFCVLYFHETVQVLTIALLLSCVVGRFRFLSVLNLRLQVVERGVLLQSLFVCHVFDHVVGLFRTEVGLLVRDFFLPSYATLLLLLSNLAQDVVLVLFVGLQLELTLGLHEHLLLLDVAEELVALRLALCLQVSKVVLETVVRSLPGLSFALVGVFSLPLHMTIDSIRTLCVHHGRVSGVECVGNVFPIERPANDIVKFGVAVAVQLSIVRYALFVEVQVHVHGRGHDVRRGHDGSAVALVDRAVAQMAHTRRSVLRLVDMGALHGLPVLGVSGSSRRVLECLSGLGDGLALAGAVAEDGVAIVAPLLPILCRWLAEGALSRLGDLALEAVHRDLRDI